MTNGVKYKILKWLIKAKNDKLYTGNKWKI